jgi:hypothetical protein
LWVAKFNGKIRNTQLAAQVLDIVLKLTESFRSHVIEAGRRRAARMATSFGKPNSILNWVPRLRGWLTDPNYLIYLGILEING